MLAFRVEDMNLAMADAQITVFMLLEISICCVKCLQDFFVLDKVLLIYKLLCILLCLDDLHNTLFFVVFDLLLHKWEDFCHAIQGD